MHDAIPRTRVIESWSFQNVFKIYHFHINPGIFSERVVTAPLKKQIFITDFGPRLKNIYTDTCSANEPVVRRKIR